MSPVASNIMAYEVDDAPATDSLIHPSDPAVMYFDPEWSSLSQPAWRWDRVRQLARHPGTAHQYSDDEYVRRGVELFIALNNAKTVSQQAHECSGFRSGYHAYSIFRLNMPMRWAIEGMVVAGMSEVQIESLTDVKIETLRWFERWFFSVRELCNLPLYVTLSLIPELLSPGGGARASLSSVWKAIGRFGDPQLMLDMMGKGKLSDGMPERIAEWMRGEISRRILLFTESTKVHSENFQGLAEMADLMPKTGEDTDATSRASEVITQMLQCFSVIPAAKVKDRTKFLPGVS